VIQFVPVQNNATNNAPRMSADAALFGALPVMANKIVKLTSITAHAVHSKVMVGWPP
jgi:hypothetical protein